MPGSTAGEDPRRYDMLVLPSAPIRKGKGQFYVAAVLMWSVNQC